MSQMSAPKYFLKQFDNEEMDTWRAKKVIQTKKTNSKINEINIQRTYSKPIVLRKNIEKSNPFTAQRLKREKLQNRGYEVVIKITSNSKNTNQLGRHIDYISRNGEVEVLDSDLDSFKGNDQIQNCLEQYQNGYIIPDEYESKREKRETYNMIFSMRDYEDCDTASLRNAAFATIKKTYPNTYFAMAIHTDTDNPHCHVCLKATRNNSSRIDIKIADLQNMRKTFAEELNKNGIEAYATRKRDRVREMSIPIKKPHYYKVLDFGIAPFNDDSKNKPSYFVAYQSKAGITKIWGENLQKIVESSKLQKGEYAKFGKIGYEAREYSFDKTMNGKTHTISTSKKIAIWDISILNRAEKDFIKIPTPKIKTTLKEKTSTIDQSQHKGNKNGIKRKYTKEQWARYYADKRTRGESKYTRYPNAAVSKSYINTLGDKPKSYQHLPTMSQSNVVQKSAKSKVLLSGDAQHNLRARTNRESNRDM